MSKQLLAIGLMSGTSLDGIDAALVHTDGNNIVECGDWISIPYENTLRNQIRETIYQTGDIAKVEYLLTLAHADAVKQLLKKADLSHSDIDVIGFHGQTIEHRPEEGITWQIGNGHLLAEETGIDVVADFRRRDVATGGQGAPLVPLFHAALSRPIVHPVAIVNIGGIANITWIGTLAELHEDITSSHIVAFDTGPGNVLINEWVYQHTGEQCDEDGKYAEKGKVNEDVVEHYLANGFFNMGLPKSLDRNAFNLNSLPEGISLEDGAATLVQVTAATIKKSIKHLPAPPANWFITGGGRHNKSIMKALRKELVNVSAVESLSWYGDALEAQAFAYLAVRAIHKLPLTIPSTTGTRKATTGGVFYPK